MALLADLVASRYTGVPLNRVATPLGWWCAVGTSMLAEASPAVAAQQAVLSKQLHELKELRHTMQAMYDASQQEVAELRAELEALQGEVARERERAAEVSAENTSLRQWNEQLNADMRRLLNELRSEASVNDADAKDEPGHEAEEAEVSHLLGAAAGSASSANVTTGISVDISVLQQAQLEASATALRLTHAQARLKRKGKELRASASQVAQLKETAQALSTDLSAATAQIGKLETRIRQQAEISRKLEQLTAEHSAQAETLEQTNEALGRAKEEQAALANGPLAEAERRIHELEARERRSRVLLERKVRQAAEMAAAVQTLGADSRVRIEENVKLRVLAERLGATRKELENVRRSSTRGAQGGDDDDDEEEDGGIGDDKGGEYPRRGVGGSGRGGSGGGGVAATGGSRGGEDLASAWVRRAEGALGLDEFDDGDEFGSVASTMRGSTTRSLPQAYAQPYTQPYTQPYAQPRLASSGGTSPGAHRSSSPRAPPPSAGSVEALQSQSALQEKLRKVRSTFADIRRQVGYDFE